MPAHGGELDGGRRRDDVVRTLQATAVFAELTVLENALVGARRGARHGGAGRTLLATPQARAEDGGAADRARRALATVGLGELADVPADELSDGSGC